MNKQFTFTIKFVILCLFIIISSIEASALSVVVHVPEKYTDIKAGERVYFEIQIKYPENPTRIDLRMNYEIEREGKTIAQTKALKAVETQASFVDFIVVPESVEGGLHTIKVKVNDYGDLNEEVSATFHVIGKGTDKTTLYFIITMSSVILLAILVFVDLFRRKESQNKINYRQKYAFKNQRIT